MAQLKTFAQLGNASGHSKDRDNSIVSGVPVLLGSRGPSTVLLEITKRIVDSVKRCVRWAFTHILQKTIELQPSVADCDSSTSPVQVCRTSDVVATLNHVSPCVVDTTSRSSVGLDTLQLTTTAGNRTSRHKVGTSYDFTISAIAPAKADRTMTSVFSNLWRGFSNNFELSKPRSWWDSFCRHSNRFIRFVFSGGNLASTKSYRVQFTPIARAVNTIFLCQSIALQTL